MNNLRSRRNKVATRGPLSPFFSCHDRFVVTVSLSRSHSYEPGKNSSKVSSKRDQEGLLKFYRLPVATPLVLGPILASVSLPQKRQRRTDRAASTGKREREKRKTRKQGDSFLSVDRNEAGEVFIREK